MTTFDRQTVKSTKDVIAPRRTDYWARLWDELMDIVDKPNRWVSIRPEDEIRVHRHGAFVTRRRAETRKLTGKLVMMEHAEKGLLVRWDLDA